MRAGIALHIDGAQHKLSVATRTNLLGGRGRNSPMETLVT